MALLHRGGFVPTFQAPASGGSAGPSALVPDHATRPGHDEILRTRRLRLRLFRPADAPWLLALLNSPGWLENIGDRGVRTEAQAVDWIEQRLIGNYHRQGHGFWAVECLDSGQPIGMSGLVHRPGLPAVDVGYALLPAWWGQGLAREAAGACLAHGHEVLGLPRILAITARHNQASMRVLAAIGMRDEGDWLMPGETEACRLFASGAPAEPGDFSSGGLPRADQSAASEVKTG